MSIQEPLRGQETSQHKPVDAQSRAPDAELINDALELLDSLPISRSKAQVDFDEGLASLDNALLEIAAMTPEPSQKSTSVAKGVLAQSRGAESKEPAKMSTRARPKTLISKTEAAEVSQVASKTIGGSRTMEEKSKVEEPSKMVRLPGRQDAQGRLVNKNESFASSLEERIHSLNSNSTKKALWNELKKLTPAERQEIRDNGAGLMAKMTSANSKALASGLGRLEAGDANKMLIQIRVDAVTNRASEGTAVKEVGETTRRWGKAALALTVLGGVFQAIGKAGSKISSQVKKFLNLIGRSKVEAISSGVDKTTGETSRRTSRDKL